jgi:hypothetical protein
MEWHQLDFCGTSGDAVIVSKVIRGLRKGLSIPYYSRCSNGRGVGLKSHAPTFSVYAFSTILEQMILEMD